MKYCLQSYCKKVNIVKHWFFWSKQMTVKSVQVKWIEYCPFRGFWSDLTHCSWLLSHLLRLRQHHRRMSSASKLEKFRFLSKWVYPSCWISLTFSLWRFGFRLHRALRPFSSLLCEHWKCVYVGMMTGDKLQELSLMLMEVPHVNPLHVGRCNRPTSK